MYSVNFCSFVFVDWFRIYGDRIVYIKICFSEDCIECFVENLCMFDSLRIFLYVLYFYREMN